MKEPKLLEVGARFSLNKVDDLYAALGDSSITVNQVINKIKEMFFQNTQLEDVLNVPQTTGVHKDRETASLKIKGVDDVFIRLAHCCNPLPGDDVLGYITRGRGVSVHRKDCPNLINYLRTEKDRIMEVEWAQESGIYVVELEVKALDRPRLTTDVMNVIADSRVQINSVFSRVTKNGLALINLKLEVIDMDHLTAVKQRIQKVKDVMDVRRVLPGEIRGE